MPSPAEDATAAAAATEAGAAADAGPAHQHGLQSEPHVTSRVTTRSKRHGPDPSEEESRAKRPKQELFEAEQRVKRPQQEPSAEEACAKAVQLNRKGRKADSAQNDLPTANTAKDNLKAELAVSVLQSDEAVQADCGNVHKLDAKGCSAAELNSDSNSGTESQSQGEQRHFQAVSCCGKHLLGYSH